MNVLHYLEFKAMGLSQEEIKSAVKLGVTPEEIKAAKAIEAAADDVVNKEPGQPAPVGKTDPAPKADPKADLKADPKGEPKAEPDYKAMYEAEKAKVSKLQADNTKTEVPEKQITADSVVNEIVKHLF